MKAVVFTQYGPPEVLQLKEEEKPTPKANEILIRVKATAVNSGDLRLRKADPFAVRLFLGLTKPKLNILGGVLSGKVEATGNNVKRFKIGDNVFGSTGMRFGAYAEYICLSENEAIALKPDSLTYSEAAVIPFGAATALYFIKKANIRSGQKVLINGASGAMGSAAVQIAKYYGAVVTGVCSTGNVALVKSLGADEVIDYSKEDFTKNGKTYDVIFDSVNKLSFSACIKLLTISGTLILSAADLSGMLHGLWTSLTSRRKVLTGIISQNVEDMIFIKSLVESGKLKPVIDRTYSLTQMAEAHEYTELGHKKGNVAITV